MIRGMRNSARGRIEKNVRFWVKAAREKGCDDPHHASEGCAGAFQAASFFDNTEFAHYKEFAVRLTGRGNSIFTKCAQLSKHRFQEFLKNGRIKWRVCHKVETLKERSQVSSCINKHSMVSHNASRFMLHAM